MKALILHVSLAVLATLGVFGYFGPPVVVASYASDDHARPAIAITYLHTGHKTPLRVGEGSKHFWFQLTNNSANSIRIRLYGVPEKYADVGLIYTVEDRDSGETLFELHRHTYSVSSLAPGQSITFSVPADHVLRAARLRLRYQFVPDVLGDSDRGFYPDHDVIFDFSSLPDDVWT